DTRDPTAGAWPTARQRYRLSGGLRRLPPRLGAPVPRPPRKPRRFPIPLRRASEERCRRVGVAPAWRSVGAAIHQHRRSRHLRAKAHHIQSWPAPMRRWQGRAAPGRAWLAGEHDAASVWAPGVARRWMPEAEFAGTGRLSRLWDAEEGVDALLR